MSAGDIDKAMHTLSDIMDDGVISEEEMPLLVEVKEKFINVRQRVEEAITILEKAERIGRF